MTRPVNPVEALNDARRAQRRMRAQTLVALEEGMIGMWDVVVLATTTDGDGLRSIPLSTLLRYYPNWTPRMAHSGVRVFRTALSLPSDTPDRKVSVSLLVDRRTYASRVVRLVDAMSTIERPSLGARFPFAAPTDR